MSDWKASLSEIIRASNARKGNGTTASAATRAKRIDTLYCGFAELRDLGYRLDDVRSFRAKHMTALAQRWEEKGLSASTIQGRISVFRQFSRWIGKEGMIESSERYVRSAGSVRRSTINMQDKSWSAHGVEPKAKIEEVRSYDERVAMALELQLAFGLRAQEACMLRPHLSDLGAVLDVRRGTKNGRPRVVEIRNANQRAVLDRAKALVRGRAESIGDPAKTLKQVRSRFDRVVRRFGIMRKNGITSHGLRHEAANDYYEEQAGNASPVRGGPLPADASNELAARLQTSEYLGHSRESATTHYLGRVRRDGEEGKA